MTLGRQVRGGITVIEVAVLVAAVGWDGFRLTKLDGQRRGLSGISYERWDRSSSTASLTLSTTVRCRSALNCCAR